MNAVRIPVLMYHRVGVAKTNAERTYCIGAERFADHMRALSRMGWRAISVDDFVSWLDRDLELPERTFVLTFDDGFAGVYEHAHPVLKMLGWPATMFLVSGLIGQTDIWPKTGQSAEHNHPLLDRRQIDVMRREGWSFHGHSRNHLDLTSLPDAELDEQLSGCRADLRELGLNPRFFAYPYGRFTEREASAVIAAGYEAAFSVQSGFNRRDVDRMRIRRLDVFGTDTPGMLLRKLALGSNDGSLATYARSLTRQFASRFL